MPDSCSPDAIPGYCRYYGDSYKQPQALQHMALRDAAIDFDCAHYQLHLHNTLSELATRPTGFWQNGFYYVGNYAHCKQLLSDEQFVRIGPDGKLFNFGNSEFDQSFIKILHDWMVFQDPPYHDELRAPLTRYFTPAKLDQLESRFQSIVEHAWQKTLDENDGDFLRHYAYAIPIDVICEMLGIALEDHARFQGWSNLITRAVNVGDEESLQLPNAELPEIYRFVDQHIAKADTLSDNNLIGALVNSQPPLSQKQIIHCILLLLWAGHETTKFWISNALLHLARDPALFAQMKTQRELLDGFLDEVLRLDSPLQKLSRWTTQPTDFGGYIVPAGTQVVAMIGAGNRDPEMFPEPGSLNMHRPKNRILSFGKGLHHCLGSYLARMEARLAIEQVLNKHEQFELIEYSWRNTSAFRALETLRINAQ